MKSLILTAILSIALLNSCAETKPFELNIAQAYQVQDTYEKIVAEVQGNDDVDSMVVDYMIIEAEKRIQELIDNGLIKPAKQ